MLLSSLNPQFRHHHLPEIFTGTPPVLRSLLWVLSSYNPLITTHITLCHNWLFTLLASSLQEGRDYICLVDCYTLALRDALPFNEIKNTGKALSTMTSRKVVMNHHHHHGLAPH